MISGESWLLELEDRGGPSRDIARRLLRLQILTEARTGHTLILGYEYTRRCITQAARYGRMARVRVECQGCHCQAWLSEWEMSCLTPARDRPELARMQHLMGRSADALYLMPCPGVLYARDCLESMHLPKEETRVP